MPPISELDRVVSFLTSFGWSGVDLFFVLSGFLITNILLNARSSASYYWPFYARRCLRIFPIYYCFLLVVGVVVGPMLVWWSSAPSRVNELTVFRENIWWYIFYITNILICLRGLDATPLWVNVFWSLAVEEQFYLIWPAFVRLLSTKRLLQIVVVAVFTAPALRGFAWIAERGVGINRESLSVLVLTPMRMDTLAMGAAVAILVRDKKGAHFVAQVARPISAISAVIIAILMVARGGYSGFDGYVQTIGFSANGLLASSLIGMCVTGSGSSKRNRILSHRVLREFGVYSYGIYIIHSPIFWSFDRAVSNRDIPMVFGSHFPFFLGGFILMTALVLALAFVSWNGMERYFLSLKRFFPIGPSLGRVGAEV
jgi:peptidoglycan/LPS O-acetylase OafA/YrhL